MAAPSSTRDIQAASLDHAMWFHRPHPLDGWLLYTQDSPSTQGARGFTRGTIYAEDGTLIASVAQEGLIRLRRSACLIGNFSKIAYFLGSSLTAACAGMRRG